MRVVSSASVRQAPLPGSAIRRVPPPPYRLLLDHDFRQVIESVKLRAPVEEIVRERVPELKRSGALWVACCPFHEERTPSFKVNPSRGTWHCFGACSTGGDVISFVQRFDNTSFMDSLELLAERVGVRLPERKSDPGAEEDARSSYQVLDRAAAFYARQLMTPEGARGLAYLRERGFTDEIIESFQIGWAPQQGSPLASRAQSGAVAMADLQRAGLCRAADDGRAYDFFRGRVIVPIRDARGRTVGFGGRCLPGQDSGPKYVNTPETPLFRKGRLIYGMELAIEHVRRERHLILVEGYMDVMAAHQVGIRHVAAVLGTSTTEEHAALIRRSGAKRVTLVFDGDDAGRRATLKALHGLLPTELEVDVVSPPAGQDPCDLCMQGEAAFAELLAAPKSWFEFVLEGLAGLPPAALGTAADEVFELLLRLPKPVHREALLGQMATGLSLSRAGLMEQFEHLKRRKSGRIVPPAPTAREAAAPEAGEGGSEARRVIEPVVLRSLRELIGCVLLDNSLMPLAEPHFERAAQVEGVEGEFEYLRVIMAALLELFADENDVRAVDATRALDALGDHPARDLVVPLEEHVLRASSPNDVAQGALRLFQERERKRRIASQRQTLSGSLEDDRQELKRLHQELVKGSES